LPELVDCEGWPLVIYLIPLERRFATVRLRWIFIRAHADAKALLGTKRFRREAIASIYNRNARKITPVVGSERYPAALTFSGGFGGTGLPSRSGPILQA